MAKLPEEARSHRAKYSSGDNQVYTVTDEEKTAELHSEEVGEYFSEKSLHTVSVHLRSAVKRRRKE